MTRNTCVGKVKTQLEPLFVVQKTGWGTSETCYRYIAKQGSAVAFGVVVLFWLNIFSGEALRGCAIEYFGEMAWAPWERGGQVVVRGF